MLFFAVVGVIELVDFAGQVSTMADIDRTTLAAEALGIGVESVRTRISLLVPLAAITSGLALNVAYGAVVGDARREGRIICAALLLVHAVGFTVSGLMVDSRDYSLGAVFLVLAFGAAFFVRVDDSLIASIPERA